MSRPVRIVVADSAEGAGRDLSIEQENFPQPFELTRFTYTDNPVALVEACRHADAILTDFAPFDREVLGRLESCKLISIAATGWDRVDTGAAKEFGISVCCIGEYCTGEVADHAMALLLALNRKLLTYHEQVQDQKSWAWDAVPGVRRLAGQTLGIVGLGRIGRAVAARARGFELNILAYDPWLKPEHIEPGVQRVELDELLGQSDIISLHCNLGPDNQAMLDRAAFARMQRKPLIINVSRGALIDEAAFCAALDGGLVAGAALDVLADEPPSLEQHPLAGRGNVILTPHVAFNSEESMYENRVISSSNIRHYFAGNLDRVNRLVHHAQKREDHESSI